MGCGESGQGATGQSHRQEDGQEEGGEDKGEQCSPADCRVWRRIDDHLMKATEANKYGGSCPKCSGETTNDLKGRGFVRHKHRKYEDRRGRPILDVNGKPDFCKYGRHERD
jgi:hypothetical protein